LSLLCPKEVTGISKYLILPFLDYDEKSGGQKPLRV
jgi:hypothetical protein